MYSTNCSSFLNDFVLNCFYVWVCVCVCASYPFSIVVGDCFDIVGSLNYGLNYARKGGTLACKHSHYAAKHEMGFVLFRLSVCLGGRSFFFVVANIE